MQGANPCPKRFGLIKRSIDMTKKEVLANFQVIKDQIEHFGEVFFDEGDIPMIDAVIELLKGNAERKSGKMTNKEAIDLLSNLLGAVEDTHGNDYGKAFHMAIEALSKDVVHGEWIKTTIAERCGADELHRTIYRDRETVKCSECGNPSPVYNIKFEFCPRCGARMDGGK